MAASGLFLSFEGIDGSGKSTQARLLFERLADAGHRPLMLREPGGTELSERVRTLLLDPDLHIEPFAELLLFSAARAQLVAERIRPALEAGHIVICDRFYDSTTAYQGAGRGVAQPDWLQGFNRRVVGGLVPDRTFFIDLDPEQAAARRASADRIGGDRMEASGAAFYTAVATAYRALADEEPGRILRLDGRQPVERLHRAIWEDVQTLGLPPAGISAAAET